MTTRPQAVLPDGFIQEGIASYYGSGHHGRRTASGAIFDEHQLTAAHRTLPFGTQVRVTNLDNGRRITLVVTDRGPFKKGRDRRVETGRARSRILGPERSGGRGRFAGDARGGVKRTRPKEMNGGTSASVRTIQAIRPPARPVSRSFKKTTPLSSDSPVEAVNEAPMRSAVTRTGIDRKRATVGFQSYVNGSSRQLRR